MLVRKIVFSPVKAAIVFLLTAAAVILWSGRTMVVQAQDEGKKYLDPTTDCPFSSPDIESCFSISGNAKNYGPKTIIPQKGALVRRENDTPYLYGIFDLQRKKDPDKHDVVVAKFNNDEVVWEKLVETASPHNRAEGLVGGDTDKDPIIAGVKSGRKNLLVVFDKDGKKLASDETILPGQLVAMAAGEEDFYAVGVKSGGEPYVIRFRLVDRNLLEVVWSTNLPSGFNPKDIAVTETNPSWVYIGGGGKGGDGVIAKLDETGKKEWEIAVGRCLPKEKGCSYSRRQAGKPSIEYREVVMGLTAKGSGAPFTETIYGVPKTVRSSYGTESIFYDDDTFVGLANPDGTVALLPERDYETLNKKLNDEGRAVVSDRATTVVGWLQAKIGGRLAFIYRVFQQGGKMVYQLIESQKTHPGGISLAHTILPGGGQKVYVAGRYAPSGSSSRDSKAFVLVVKPPSSDNGQSSDSSKKKSAVRKKSAASDSQPSDNNCQAISQQIEDLTNRRAGLDRRIRNLQQSLLQACPSDEQKKPPPYQPSAKNNGRNVRRGLLESFNNNQGTQDSSRGQGREFPNQATEPKTPTLVP